MQGPARAHRECLTSSTIRRKTRLRHLNYPRSGSSMVKTCENPWFCLDPGSEAPFCTKFEHPEKSPTKPMIPWATPPGPPGPPNSLLKRPATILQPLQSSARESLPKSRLNSFLQMSKHGIPFAFGTGPKSEIYRDMEFPWC